jgi:hypothetical protein
MKGLLGASLIGILSLSACAPNAPSTFPVTLNLTRDYGSLQPGTYPLTLTLPKTGDSKVLLATLDGREVLAVPANQFSDTPEFENRKYTDVITGKAESGNFESGNGISVAVKIVTTYAYICEAPVGGHRSCHDGHRYQIQEGSLKQNGEILGTFEGDVRF